jgi:hypothetical protein
MAERRSVIIIGTTTTVFVGLILIWAFAQKLQSPSAILNEVTDKAVIEKQLELSHVGIETSENYFGNHIRIIHGTIRNLADKPLRLVEMKMVFHDFDGKSVQETVHRAFNPTQKPLTPGTTYRFQVNFENLPKTWNYHIPDIEVVRVAY